MCSRSEGLCAPHFIISFHSFSQFCTQMRLPFGAGGLASEFHDLHYSFTTSLDIPSISPYATLRLLLSACAPVYVIHQLNNHLYQRETSARIPFQNIFFSLHPDEFYSLCLKESWLPSPFFQQEPFCFFHISSTTNSLVPLATPGLCSDLTPHLYLRVSNCFIHKIYRLGLL